MSRISTGPVRDGRAFLTSCGNGIGLGTGVLTAEGELPVEFLEPGDRIVTFDHGLARLERIEVRMVPAEAALRIRPSVLDPNGDGRDFILSARQQLLLRDWRARILFNRPIALVAAEQLIDGAHVARLDSAAPVRLFRLVFKDRQHLVEAAGGHFQLASARQPVRQPG